MTLLFNIDGKDFIIQNLKTSAFEKPNGYIAKYDLDLKLSYCTQLKIPYSL